MSFAHVWIPFLGFLLFLLIWPMLPKAFVGTAGVK